MPERRKAMRAGMIACSEAAYDLMILVRERWQQKHPEDELEYKVKCRALSSISMAETVTELTGSLSLIHIFKGAEQKGTSPAEDDPAIYLYF